MNRDVARAPVARGGSLTPDTVPPGAMARCLARCRRASGAWAVLLLGCAAGTGAQTASAGVERAAWLAGCWRLTAGDRTTDEQWMAPGGEVMLGMSRTVRAGRVVEEERIRIHVALGKLTYTAHPSGQSPADFTLSRASDSLLEFENAAHDFPQRIRYRLLPADSLIAQIEGSSGGQTRVIGFPMVRVSCEPTPKP